MSKKYRFLKRKVVVTVSNSETTAKAADILAEGHMLNALYVFHLSLQFCGLKLLSVLYFTFQISSLYEAVYTFRHHYRDP